MYCWYCHWGWPLPAVKIYHEALSKLGGNYNPLDLGPGHIVWGDENFNSAQYCLDHFDDWPTNYDSPEDLEVIRWSLEELTKIPPEQLDAKPENYDGVHPEDYPPLVPVEHP